MSLSTDKFFYWSLSNNDDVADLTDGRIFNTAREDVDEEEDKVPYVIISNEGTQNDAESKDDVGESDTDIDGISVLVVADSREALAELTATIRETIRNDMDDFDVDMEAEMGFGIEDYSFSAGPVQYDWTKPCFYQTLNYQVTTNI